MWGNVVSPEGKEVAIPHDTESQQDSIKLSPYCAGPAVLLDDLGREMGLAI